MPEIIKPLIVRRMRRRNIYNTYHWRLLSVCTTFVDEWFRVKTAPVYVEFSLFDRPVPSARRVWFCRHGKPSYCVCWNDRRYGGYSVLNIILQRFLVNHLKLRPGYTGVWLRIKPV